MQTQALLGEDVIYHGMPKYHHPEESSLFLSLGHHLDMYFPPCKRSRVSDPFMLCESIDRKKQPTVDVLPDECLFEIFRRVSGDQEKSACALVSKRWLMLLSTICKDEVVNKNDAEDFDQNGGCLTRCLKGKKATDVRLAAIGVGSSGHGGLCELSILGNAASKATDLGLKAIARGCSSLTSLTLWNLNSIGDEGVGEIANECSLLEKLELCQIPTISDKCLLAIANNCPNLTSLVIESCSNIGNEGLQAIGRKCSNLTSISIKNCPLVGDQGIVSLVSSATCSLKKIGLYGLNITDMSLAVIGHYGIAVTDLGLGFLRNVTEKGFWVMASGQGLQHLKTFAVVDCIGVTDLVIEAVGKGCPNLKVICIRKSAFLSDSGIVSFAKAAKSLETITLEECHRVGQIGIFGLVLNCGKLSSLSLLKCLGIKDSPMIIPSTLSPSNSLTSISIRNCPGFGNFSLTLLGRLCRQLQHVVLTSLRITDVGLTSLVHNCESGLIKIDLSGCVNLTDKVVSEISEIHGGTLEVLNLDGCRSISDASMVAVSQNCLVLKELNVSKSAITDFAIAALACAEKFNLQILSVSGCNQVSNNSLPFLRKLGESLIGLNIMQCRGVGGSAVGDFEEQMWKCDTLV